MRTKYFFFINIGLICLVGAGCVLSPAPYRPEAINSPTVSVPATNEPAQPSVAAFGSEVPLKIGASVSYDDGLSVSLEQINDSRCPQGVQCFWQGELAPVLTLRGGSLAGETKLTFGTVRGLTGAAGDYALTMSSVTENTAVVVVTKPAVAAHPRPDMIRLNSPQTDESVGSPLVVKGEARGTWYFEASFPVKLFDTDGKLLAVVPARAQGDWMTENYVPFLASLAFDKPATATGMLVLEKDNPSGLPENADELRLPVKFAAPTGQQRRVKLYFYDPAKDRDETGNVLCSRQGLTPVERDIPVTKTPIQDAVRLLLLGGLTDSERDAGITTEFPLLGVELKGAVLKDGALTLEFSDPNNRTGGGSCRVGILWHQIEATARQFPEVSSVKFMPEELFQP
jgi:hypothetical protein